MRAALTEGARRGERSTSARRRSARGDLGRRRLRPRGPARHRCRAGPEHRVERRAQGVPQAAGLAAARSCASRRIRELAERVIDVTTCAHRVRVFRPGSCPAATCRRSCSRGSSPESRWCSSRPSPTRGLDVAGIETVHSYLREAAARGSRRAADQRGPRRDPGARRPDRSDVRGRVSPGSVTQSRDGRRARPADGRRRGAKTDADRAPAPAALVAHGRRSGRVDRGRVRPLGVRSVLLTGHPPLQSFHRLFDAAFIAERRVDRDDRLGDAARLHRARRRRCLPHEPLQHRRRGPALRRRDHRCDRRSSAWPVRRRR